MTKLWLSMSKIKLFLHEYDFEQKYPEPAVTVPSYNAMMEFFVLTFFRDILRKFISGLLKD